MGKVSQCQKVLNHLNTHRCITQREATDKYDILRLSARIKDLRDMGYLIKTTTVTRKNKEGNTSNFAEYSLMTEGDFNEKAE